MIFIFSENYWQAMNCAQENMLEDMEWRYLESSRTLRGVAKESTVWEYGTAHMRKDYMEVMYMIGNRDCYLVKAPSHV